MIFYFLPAFDVLSFVALYHACQYRARKITTEISKCPRFGLSSSFLIFNRERKLFNNALRVECTSGPILGIILMTVGLPVTLLRFMRTVV